MLAPYDTLPCRFEWIFVHRPSHLNPSSSEQEGQTAQHTQC